MPRSTTRNAYETGASDPVSSVSTSINVDSVAGLTAPLYLVIDPDDASKREYIFVTALGGSSLDSVVRGLAGSAAGAQSHDTGVRIRAVFMHQMLDDIWDGIDDSFSSTGGTINGDLDLNGNNLHNVDQLTFVPTGSISGVLSIFGSSLGELDIRPGTGQGLSLADDIGTDRLDISSSAIGDWSLNDVSGVPVLTWDQSVPGLISSTISMAGTKITNLGLATLATDALSQAAGDARYLQLIGGILSGGLTLGAALAMGGFKITGLGDATAGTDALNRVTADGRYLQLSGGAMTGDFNMGTHLITNLGDPVGALGALNRQTGDGRYLMLSGGTMSGDVNMGNKEINNLGNPTGAQGALNRQTGDGRYIQQTGGVGQRIANLDGIDSAFEVGGTGARITFLTQGGYSLRTNATNEFLIQSGAGNNAILFTTAGRVTLPNAGTTTDNGLPSWRQLGSADRSVNALTSSLRYKRAIRPLETEPQVSLIKAVAAKLISWQEKGSPKGSPRITGISAEDAYEILPRVVSLDAFGRPDAVDPANAFAVPMLATVAQLLERVEKLEAALA